MGCDWCAYVLDESIVYRDWSRVNREVEAEQIQREFQGHSARTAQMTRELRG